MEAKCDNFEIISMISDSECFDNDFESAKTNVIKNPEICEICIYNKKHNHRDYNSWQAYRKEIGIPPRR